MYTSFPSSARPGRARDCRRKWKKRCAGAESLQSCRWLWASALQHPDQLAAIPADIRPDAAVFGSALLKHLDKGNTAKAFLEVWTR